MSQFKIPFAVRFIFYWVILKAALGVVSAFVFTVLNDMVTPTTSSDPALGVIIILFLVIAPNIWIIWFAWNLAKEKPEASQPLQ